MAFRAKRCDWLILREKYYGCKPFYTASRSSPLDNAQWTDHHPRSDAPLIPVANLGSADQLVGNDSPVEWKSKWLMQWVSIHGDIL